MVAGQPQLQQQPGSVQFRQPLPPANLRPGMRLGSPGALVQVRYCGVRNELGLSTNSKGANVSKLKCYTKILAQRWRS